MAASRPPPAATTPSACFFSAFSIASAYSLASTAMSAVKMASTPASGPSPTART